MAEVKEITTLEEWQGVFESSSEQPVFVFKHSTTCPVSAEAWKEFQNYLSENPNGQVNYVLVKVIESRPVSNKVAEEVGVKHASPQAILVKDQEAMWNASHFKITKKAIADLLS